jgi:pyrimidine deaminase RibD-like protein
VSLRLATKIAHGNRAYVKWPLGCVITKGGSVQSVGWSALKSDPRFAGCSIHAEEHALRQMGYQADGCVLYVARVTKRGHRALAKPCSACQQLIVTAGVKRVVWTVDDREFGVWRP